jgi:ketosteroid isomerase-like protein
MSQENVEVVQALVAASQRGDWDAALDHYDQAVELDQSRMLDGGVYYGRDGVRDFFTDWFGTWDRLVITPERFLDAGERVVVVLQIAGVGKGSRVEVSIRVADVFTLRSGKVVRQAGYFDVSEALEAAGLSE